MPTIDIPEGAISLLSLPGACITYDTRTGRVTAINLSFRDAYTRACEDENTTWLYQKPGDKVGEVFYGFPS